MKSAFIYDAIRTPRGKGKASGALYESRPVSLLATLFKALEQRNELIAKAVDDVLIGCVTPIDDQGANIAKASLFYADWPDSVPGMQLNRFCASGLESVNLAAKMILSGVEDLIVAGGVESMSRVPMETDGGALLFDPELAIKANYLPQGVSADLLATLNDISRSEADQYALLSQQRAAISREKGHFNHSIIPICDASGLEILRQDEHPRPQTSLEDLSQLPSAFRRIGEKGFDTMALKKYPVLEKINHIHTAGNSSGIVDGASLVLVGSAEKGAELGLKPRAKIIGMATVGSDPTIMLDGPAPACQKALKKAGMEVKDIDLWEMNEAFAAPVIHFQRTLGFSSEIVNVKGGAIALGHPLGATGAILLGTLLDELERSDLATGVITMCVGAGMGIATIIERV